MKILEYGKQNEKTLLFMPAALTHHTWYEKIIDLLSQKYHVYIAVYDGYDSPFDKSFKSVDDTSKKIIEYFRSIGKTPDIIYGFCMGGAISNRIIDMGLSPDIFIMESAIMPYQFSKFFAMFPLIRDVIGVYILRNSKSLLKSFLPSEVWVKEGEDKEKFYEELKDFLKKFTYKTIKNTFYYTNNYKIDKWGKENKNIYYIYGSKEKKERKWDIRDVKKVFKNVKFKEIDGLNHGEFVLLNEKLCFNTIEEIINNSKLGG